MFQRWILSTNIDKSTLNQRGYQVDRRHDVISTYINVESTLGVCWELISIVNWIFHLSDFLRSFMISFKYDLILLKYSLTNSVLFYHRYFHIHYNCYSKNYFLLLLLTLNYLLLLVYNNILHGQKVLSIGNYPSLTASFSFFSLEISLISLTVVSSISIFSLKETPKQLFFSECCKIFNNSFFIEHLQ